MHRCARCVNQNAVSQTLFVMVAPQDVSPLMRLDVGEVE
jgi:hypothetical protein